MAAPPPTNQASNMEGGRDRVDVLGLSEDSEEWEYEYDETATEDIYFTLDLTTFQSDKWARSKTLESKTRTPISNHHSQDAAPTAQPREPLSESASPTPYLPQPQAGDRTTPSRIDSKLQFLDLHTDSPLVLFDNTLYNCHWSTAYGSQLYIAPSNAVKPSLRPGYVLDVVGLSRAKLVGRPSNLRPRKQTTQPTVGLTVENAITIDDPGDESDANDVTTVAEPANDDLPRDSLTAQQRFAALRQRTQNPTVKAKASFLELLSDIKQKRGESDLIPFYGVKHYHVPEEVKDEIKQKYPDVEAELAQNAASLIGRRQKRGSYKRQRQPSTTAEDVNRAKTKRKKPGPKSGEEVWSAVGLATSGN